MPSIVFRRSFFAAHGFFLLVATAAALTTIGAHWRLIDQAGSPVPYLDQWHGEGTMLYQPALEGKLTLSTFLQPHNGHRLVASRLLAYLLFHWNGQWDVRLQMVVNAFLAGALCFPLLALVRDWLRPPGLVAFAAVLAGFYSSTVLYENTLWGFQSCFYFLVLFSLLQLRLMLLRPALSAGWWLGVAFGVCAALAMGSGLLSSAAIVGSVLCRAVRERDFRRDALLTSGAALAVFLLGAWWLPSEMRGYLETQPSRPGGFFHTVVLAFAFPGREYSFAGLLVWLPFGVFAVASVALRTLTATAGVLAATGLWVVMQIAAMGYARPEMGPVLPNRYYEVLAIGLFANFAVWSWFWRQGNFRARRLAWRALFVALLCGWLSFVGRSAIETARMNRTHVVDAVIRPSGKEQVERVRNFLHTDDPRAIAECSPLALPFPDVRLLIEFLRKPELRSIMPFELRTPIALQFPTIPGRPSLDNAVPVSLGNEPGKLHRGTFFHETGAAAIVQATSTPAFKAARHLMFKVAGDLRAGETELRVHDGRGAPVAVITDLHADSLQSVEVTVPGSTFSVEVVDRSPQRWLAFVEPVEVGPLSHGALIGLRHAGDLAWLGVTALGLLLLWSLRRNRSAEAVSMLNER